MCYGKKKMLFEQGECTQINKYSCIIENYMVIPKFCTQNPIRRGGIDVIRAKKLLNLLRKYCRGYGIFYFSNRNKT